MNCIPCQKCGRETELRSNEELTTRICWKCLEMREWLNGVRDGDYDQAPKYGAPF